MSLRVSEAMRSEQARIAYQLSKIAQAKGITQSEIGERLGTQFGRRMTKQYINSVLNCRQDVSPYQLSLIAKVLGYRLELRIVEEGSEAKPEEAGE